MLLKYKINNNSLIMFSFRRLCSHLYLQGETQQVDRILFQFAQQYWDCLDPAARKIFIKPDVIYGILFSLVLLNTDLHIANIASSKRMNRRAFVKNTMELIEKMVADDASAKRSSSEFQDGNVIMNSSPPRTTDPILENKTNHNEDEQNAMRTWKKDIEVLLKVKKNIWLMLKKKRIVL